MTTPPDADGGGLPDLGLQLQMQIQMKTTQWTPVLAGSKDVQGRDMETPQWIPPVTKSTDVQRIG